MAPRLSDEERNARAITEVKMRIQTGMPKRRGPKLKAITIKAATPPMLGKREPPKPTRLDSLWVTTCVVCGALLEVSPARLKPKRTSASVRCLEHSKAGVACARFVRAAAVVEMVSFIGGPGE